MTDSTDEKTPLHTRLSPQNEDFDFDLADVQLISEHRESSEPSPIDHFDEPIAVIDQEHLANPAIDVQFVAQEEARNFHSTESLMPNVQTASEIKTNFYVDYFDKRKKKRAAPLVSPDPVQAVETLPVEEVVSPVPTPNEEMHFGESQNSPQEEFYFEESKADTAILEDDNAPVIDGAGMAVAVLSQFKSKQESINRQQEKLIQDFRKKITNTTRLTYTAAFFGIAALVSAGTFGVMLLKNNAEISDLAGTTTSLKDDIRNIKTMPADLEGTDPSLDQLNKKVDDVAGRLDQVTALQNKVASLEKALQARQQAAAIAAAKSVAPVATVASVPTEMVNKPIPAKSGKPVKNNGAAQVTAVNTTEAEAPATKASVPASKRAVETTLPPNDINNLVAAPVPAASASNPQASKVANPPANTSGWTVNLASSNQLADAKKTAESYAQKGVPVTITPITVKNETRYRIQVKGFKNKEEASAYATKAKDALKLNSVWINP